MNYNFPSDRTKGSDVIISRGSTNLILKEENSLTSQSYLKDVKILNGDISEDVAKSQAKTLVDQLQSQKAHEKYHMIQSIHTDSDVGDVELASCTSVVLKISTTKATKSS